jgi:tetratricopeptide (TPR) repeat protein
VNTLTSLSVTQANEETYNKLLVSLEAGLGMLQIFIAVCDGDRQREEIIANYERELASTAHNYRVYLDPQEPSLRLAISQQVTVREKVIATVTGTEGWSDRGESVEKFFGYLQWTREGLREFKMPIVLWIPARIFAQLAKQAPDFYSWRNGIFQFQPEPSLIAYNVSGGNPGAIGDAAKDSSSSLFSVGQLESSLAQGIQQWGENSRNLEPLYSQLGSLYASRVQSRESEDREREYALAQEYLNKAIALQTQFKQEESLSTSLYNLARLYSYHREYEQAEALYRQALEINRAGENQAEIAKVLNNLANLHYAKNEMAIAEPKYQESLQIYRNLGDLPNVAKVLNNWAVLHSDINEMAIALAEYQEALQITRELAVENPRSFLPDVTDTLNNLAVLHADKNEMVIAEQEYQEALEIRRELAVENPRSFLPDVADTLNNLAILHADKNEMVIAEQEYQEALQIRRELAVENPRSFLPYVATTLNNLANLHADKNEMVIALAEYQEALQIRRELAVENPRSFLPYVAVTLLNLSIFYKQAKPEKSLALAQEVLEIAQEFPDLPSVQKNVEKARRILKNLGAN